MHRRFNRRTFLTTSAAGLLATGSGFSHARLAAAPAGSSSTEFQLRYVVASCMYGTLPLAEILREVRRSGAGEIDIWPRRHGDQREQIEAMGHDRFAELLEEHQVKLRILTHYDLGPFGLEADLPLAKRFQVPLMVSGSRGPKNLKGAELKAAVQQFVEKLQPHCRTLGDAGVTIAIENHSNSLVSSPDSIRWFAEAADKLPVGIALAPYHLPQDPALLAGLITGLGPKLVHFYAWEHGMGCMTKLPKDQELMQLPGRGSLDFAPLIQALRKMNYAGGTSVFMHPVPRGIPILPQAGEVTEAILASRKVLERSLADSPSAQP